MNIKETLINKYGYVVSEAATMETELLNLDEKVAVIFENWKATGDESSSVDFEGYSIDSLKEDYEMNFFASLVTLDWIVKEPQVALSALAEGIM